MTAAMDVLYINIRLDTASTNHIMAGVTIKGPPKMADVATICLANHSEH